MTATSKGPEQTDNAVLPVESDGLEPVKIESPASSLVAIELAVKSHEGNVRLTNEDHYLVVRAERSLNTVQSNLPEGALKPSFHETAFGMAIADGIGGMPAGGVASRMALRKLVDLVVKTPDWVMRMDRRKANTVMRRMANRFRQIDITLRRHSERDPRLAGMGTTMTVACSLGSDLFVGHIGDSRAYLIRRDELHQLTRDHTVAQRMIDAKVAGEQDDSVRGFRRVLTAALGSTSQPSDPDVLRFYLRDGDQLLLCTDGLTEHVDSETIASILRHSETAEDACKALVGEALNRGGVDNVTVLLARYRFPKAERAADTKR